MVQGRNLTIFSFVRNGETATKILVPTLLSALLDPTIAWSLLPSS